MLTGHTDVGGREKEVDGCDGGTSKTRDPCRSLRRRRRGAGDVEGRGQCMRQPTEQVG